MSAEAPITVVKIGGSVLTGPAAYRRAAAFVAARLCEHPGERLVVVVSAEQGLTDDLLSQATDICPEPDPLALDLLWSTGELRSVALLTLSLHALGVRAVGLNAHQTGLSVDGQPEAVAERPLRILSALWAHEVVVAPGFLAGGAADAIVSLGRGGSDLTAVLLAAGIGARRCELVKDVPGYFTADPHEHADAVHVESLSWTDALRLADAGCDLVQRQAIETARARALPLIVRALGASAHTTLGGEHPTGFRVDSNQLARTA